ncbi:hypothetical protein ACI2LF_36815 [Kribbella sp. NPDC020789]
MRELLTRYVDEQTPEEAPPFEYVERAARGRKARSRAVAALVTAVVVAGGATLAVIDRPRADQEPAGPEMVVTVDVHTGEPTEGLLDDGPPPEQFRYGKTVLVLAGELRIASVTTDPQRPTVLTVALPREPTSSYNMCLPDTVVRILSQDRASIRVAAYRYRLGSESIEGQQCAPRQFNGDNLVVDLDLRRPVGSRTVYAGAAGKRVLQY